MNVTCGHFNDVWFPGSVLVHGLHYCRAAGEATAIGPTVEGRRISPIAYCADHGGRPRADVEARLDWSRACPLPVHPDPLIDEMMVQRAGGLALTSDHVYLVIREIPEGGRWVVSVGLGSYEVNLKGSYASEAEAVEAGTAVWRQRVEARVAYIRAQRGGTLAWGLPVEPRAEPIILRPRRGETAWDVEIERRTAAGEV